MKCLKRAQDHKVIDIWLLMLIHTNGKSLQKSVEKIIKKKIVEGCIQDVMFDQCIHGNKELVQVWGLLHAFTIINQFAFMNQEMLSSNSF